MSKKLVAHSLLQRQGPLLMVVLDGVGLGSQDEFDAVHQANTPVLDGLMQKKGLFIPIAAHGKAVGMPTDGDMGNSEVGHNALGCGRIVTQGAGLVDQALASGSLAKSTAFSDVMNACHEGRTLHLLGLLSDGGVHSRLDQLELLLSQSAVGGAKKIRLHMLLDGRDVEDGTALLFIEKLEKHLDTLRSSGVDVKIASGGGRMGVTMDRYEADWSIVERGYNAHVLGDARRFSSAEVAIQTFREEQQGLSDQNLPAFVVEKDGNAIGKVEDGDAVVCFNFRGDRVIEISRAFIESESEWDDQRFVRDSVPDVVYAGMMQYDGDLNLPPRFLVAPPVIDDTAGELLVKEGIRSFACSETQKFGHVTYFWNGNRSGTFDESLETFIEIPSDNISFDEKPEMKAKEIAAATIEAMRSSDFDFLRINLANGDMVGHTGNLAATVAAVESVDQELGKLLAVVDEIGGSFIVTADHGNADDMAMRTKDGAPLERGGKVIAKTSHTLAKVPFCIGGIMPGGMHLVDDVNVGLANVTATYLNLLGFETPVGWEPSLLRFADEG
ncbi:MAG: 2,3-bisphosphoglycerate-independent phosphoglycerate mutase [Deltaproteobacteria bacterium]|nr:2,3-bisphosphoglycerate-independent phosphoglycerate mutase [Deltaproteobacteria bacterium]